jgi:hypothetical protein
MIPEKGREEPKKEKEGENLSEQLANAIKILAEQSKK